MYSQYEEEKHILNYFATYKAPLLQRFTALFKKKTLPTLLDIGGNDGVTHSNSLALILQGFDALVVEPSIMAVTNARINYQMLNKKVTVAACALGSKTEPKTFWDFNQRHETSIYGYFSTFRFFELPENEVRKFFTKTEVDTMDYKTLCHTYKRYHFDFITIDTCGHELNILPQIDLSKTKLVCIAYTDESIWRIIELCRKKGLRKILYQSPANILIGR